MKRTITFSIKPEISEEEQDKLLLEISEFSGVEHVNRIAPDISDLLATRICYATVDAKQESQIIYLLSGMPDIKFAIVPPERFSF